MCCKTMCNKILPAVFIIIALALALTLTFFRQQAFATILNINHFFDVMIPVLAVGALIKYLFGCGCCCGNSYCSQPEHEREHHTGEHIHHSHHTKKK